MVYLKVHKYRFSLGVQLFFLNNETDSGLPTLKFVGLHRKIQDLFAAIFINKEMFSVQAIVALDLSKLFLSLGRQPNQNFLLHNGVA